MEHSARLVLDMPSEQMEIEGYWEQIAEHAMEFAGKRLRLIVLPEQDSAPEQIDRRPIQEKIKAIMADVPDEELRKLPQDLSGNIDHYLYGAPRR